MKKNPILTIALVSALIAILVVVVLKLLGYENPTVIVGFTALIFGDNWLEAH